jgi:hypothetical protein
VSTTTATIKAGTMVTTGSVIADAAIFSDITYLYLAIIGAFVSVTGVAHEVFGQHRHKYSAGAIAMELLKGLALGVLAIPFWYLTLASIGPGAIKEYLGVVVETSTFTSLSLIISFGLSWFTVPIFDIIAKSVPAVFKSVISRFTRKEK